MRIAVFGLTVSSSWGNGHATLWRGLLRALAQRGCHSTFFERDVPYYAATRDLHAGDGWDLALYSSWSAALPAARAALRNADVAMVTSYCPDAAAASELIAEHKRLFRVFYDLDTPVTLGRLERGERVEYIPRDGLSQFDLVLSFTGGRALDELRSALGARRTAPLYGSVVHAAVTEGPGTCALISGNASASSACTRPMRAAGSSAASARPLSAVVNVVSSPASA